jgi:hypothetical protein
MPRPASDLTRYSFRLSPADWDRLEAIARHHGWWTESGGPNRSRAVRELAAREADRIARGKSRKTPG